jgi:hypothetical protein
VKIRLKILQSLLNDIHRDLSRPHAFAYERVGFISCSIGTADDAAVVLLVRDYHPVADDHYKQDASAGAVIDRSAFRIALQIALSKSACMFHIHRHEQIGKPWFSGIDLRENARFVPDFWNVKPELPHGAIVLSHDSASGLCWYPGRPRPIRIAEFWAVGSHTEKM